MDSITFSKKCQPLNKEFRKMFDYVPCPDEYECSQDVFYQTLESSVLNKRDDFVSLTQKYRMGI
ncbi:hypothetical protein bpr_II350 (plasmid) [Butyrivibrio proteoclasticus B316]|uniref:Uncharacterized protein n=1 Tax=Butyrivibrio proteoclasticus (strain ATCC 51982 / DSM 14932 / B316) TaxID=515622 RepID=E0S4F5_BUTPB|nr:hypothetical protein bpr_II350 [Butyrivibrio proteoclasticus B316]